MKLYYKKIFLACQNCFSYVVSIKLNFNISRALLIFKTNVLLKSFKAVGIGDRPIFPPEK